MQRRTFHRLCGGLLGGAALAHRASTFGGETGPWPRTRLVDIERNPVSIASLAVGESRVFHYPYRVTPCFLLRLDRRVLDGGEPDRAETDRRGAAGADTSGTDTAGRWSSGLGEDGSVVAFSAICSHKMSHPARPISHIAYRDEPVDFLDRDGARQSREGVISCCSERSVYDPADGARVLAGPAPTPLAAIELALDDDGTVVAVASHGADRYEAFLDTFGFRLALEHGSSDVRRMSGAETQAVPAASFSRQQVRC